MQRAQHTIASLTACIRLPLQKLLTMLSVRFEYGMSIEPCYFE